MEEDFLEARQAVESGHPSVIAAGRVDGSIENMMYGLSATSMADLITGFSYYTPPPKECALLGHLEHATPEDPFHSADFIWALPKLPSFVDQLDVCFLKATGMGVDEYGKRYGYLVLHSVELPQCPEFNKITRAKMYFACLFRETDDGYLDVMARGIFNLEASRTNQPIRTIGVHPAEPEFAVVADYYLNCPSQFSLSSSLSDSDEDKDAPLTYSLDTVGRNRKRDDTLKMNSSADDSLVGYEFEDDRFSDMSELDSVDFSFSSRKDVEDDELELDLQTELRPETLAGSDTNEVVPWGGGYRTSGDDAFTTSTDQRRQPVKSSMYQQDLMERLHETYSLAIDVHAQMQMNAQAMRNARYR
ncbi:hypothetical protein BBO99_00002362 [Phytophthora kernoviae]|uniref:START domain-containing protein n=2 Tax=Phytophthora kernoviae TaxID=325452 RepID=A0A3R7K7G5_9STRA|nr:hypothetical protein G195_002856 [Phytophthora kernoviae 00238/432]KAG2529554.1 hypothetical protein JM16_002035 [Phytophthora kernoviae]KAG2530454.1 hypothetical protein JM18_002140 [Phytophthora kernoviae]RLN31323.1 hypothetical protein BBI17_002266 [Phytophthora kernoviae]RLN83159.1 hypothetical protein BBO99_00002362 [Phytophthora kernoviae]